MKLSPVIVSLMFVCALVQPAVCAGQSEEASPPATDQAAAPIAPGPAPPVTPSAPVTPAPATPAAPIEKDASKAGAEAPAAVKTTSSASGSRRYVIGPLDVLVIKVWNNPQLSGPVDVNTDGMITMALVGDIKAEGLTAQQLKETIAQRLHDFLNNPEVTVEVAKVNSKRYFVYGGVGRPGEFPLIEKTTIMDALSLVGGFKEFAKENKIRIQRGTQTFYFNYKDFSRGKNMDKNVNIELQSGDRIYVPE